MFEVIAFLIEHFQDWETCPNEDDLSRILADAGFEDEDIVDALACLQELTSEEHFRELAEPSAAAIRVFLPEEEAFLPVEVRGLLHFLAHERAVTARQLEFIVYALSCIAAEDITVEHTKLLTLMVLWAHKSELPVLIGDELLAALHGNTTMH